MRPVGVLGGMVGPEVERAARLVLGRDLGPGVRRDELRRAFRRRALELHPDRAASLGREPADLTEEFRALCSAYELLVAAATERGPAEGAAEPPPRARREGGLPPRPLRFAEYLYYSGRISWAELAEAIAWQRRAGRRIGHWFVERGLILAAEVRGVREALDRHNSRGRPAPR
jgi:hypothetical protein